jgi:hypothetical protein
VSCRPIQTPELIFVHNRQDCYNGCVVLTGETERDDRSLGEWLNGLVDTVRDQSIAAYYKPMNALSAMSLKFLCTWPSGRPAASDTANMTKR